MNKSDLLRVGREVLRPSDSGDVVEWLESNVTAIPDSPMPGPFRSDRTPWIAEALRITREDPESVGAYVIKYGINQNRAWFNIL